ncbi:hypothetical protein ACFS07_09115 [Undibacterium arcticum]
MINLINLRDLERSVMGIEIPSELCCAAFSLFRSKPHSNILFLGVEKRSFEHLNSHVFFVFFLKKFPPQKNRSLKIEHTIVMRNNPGLGIVPTSDLGEDKLKPSR